VGPRSRRGLSFFEEDFQFRSAPRALSRYKLSLPESQCRAPLALAIVRMFEVVHHRVVVREIDADV
jgi:hypothetical protein